MLPARRTERDVDPIEEIDRLRREMWALLREPWPLTAGDAHVPLADLEETDTEFVLEIELPGVGKGDVNIELDGRRVVVTAQRKERERVGILRRRTRRIGEFRHEVVLPVEVEEDRVQASLDDGVLTIRLPKTQAARPRRIAVQ